MFSLFAEFVIQVKEENGDRHKLHVSVHQSVSHNYSVGGLRPGKNYEITVTAKNRFGESAPSERIKIVTDQAGKRLFSFILFPSSLSPRLLTHGGVKKRKDKTNWTQADVLELESNAGRARASVSKISLGENDHSGHKSPPWRHRSY